MPLSVHITVVGIIIKINTNFAVEKYYIMFII